MEHYLNWLVGYVLLAADYSQLELRIVAHLSQDSRLVPLLNQGGDVFKMMTSQWKGVPVTAVTDSQRQQAKQVSAYMTAVSALPLSFPILPR